jgi:hypothetical protein
VRVAIPDEPIDLEDPCSAGAGLTVLLGAPGDEWLAHGSHVASLVFPKQGSRAFMSACEALIAPFFGAMAGGPGAAQPVAAFVPAGNSRWPECTERQPNVIRQAKFALPKPGAPLLRTAPPSLLGASALERKATLVRQATLVRKERAEPDASPPLIERCREIPER